MDLLKLCSGFVALASVLNPSNLDRQELKALVLDNLKNIWGENLEN